MKINSKLDRELSKAEQTAIDKVVLILESAFGKKMFKATINADTEDQKEVFGLSFAFDMRKDDTQ